MSEASRKDINERPAHLRLELRRNHKQSDPASTIDASAPIIRSMAMDPRSNGAGIPRVRPRYTRNASEVTRLGSTWSAKDVW